MARIIFRNVDEKNHTKWRNYFSFFQGAETANSKLFKGLATQKKWKRTSKMVGFILSSFLSILIALLLTQSGTAFAQDNKVVTPLTADSLASGNYKDVLSSFYQLAINDLTGPNKALAFTSNPFSIMARANSKYNVDTNYYKYRRLRDFNFNFNFNLDTAYRFSGLTIGAKYALINKRDQTVSRDFIRTVLAANSTTFLTDLNRVVSAIKSNIDFVKKHQTYPDEADSFIHGWPIINDKDTACFSFNNFPKDIQDTILATLEQNNFNEIKVFLKLNPDFNFQDSSKKNYNALVSEFQNKPLVTIGASATYNQNSFNSANYTAEYLAGFINPRQSFNLESDLKLDDLDSLITTTNSYRNIFSAEYGLNLVIKGQSDGKSFLEFKLSGSYYHIFSGPNPGEKQDSLTINGVLRVLIYKGIWLPVTLQYDPRTGNLFGFLNVTANFTGITNFFKKSGS